MSEKCLKDAGAQGPMSALDEAKHECEELKEGAWLEPGLDLLRKNGGELD